MADERSRDVGALLRDLDAMRSAFMQGQSTDGASWNLANAVNASALANYGPIIDSLRASPVWIPRPVTLKRYGVRIGAASGAGGLIRIGIYSADLVTMKPGALIHDAGSFATDVLNTDRTSADNLGIALAAGLYFIGSNASVSVSGNVVGVANAAAPILPSDSIANAGRTMWVSALAYGALPANFPAVTYANMNSSVPLAMFAQFIQ